jgi:hypothetical protein
MRVEMEFKKLHLGTACYTKETMDDLAFSLRTAFSDGTSFVGCRGRRLANRPVQRASLPSKGKETLSYVFAPLSKDSLCVIM